MAESLQSHPVTGSITSWMDLFEDPVARGSRCQEFHPVNQFYSAYIEEVVTPALFENDYPVSPLGPDFPESTADGSPGASDFGTSDMGGGPQSSVPSALNTPRDSEVGSELPPEVKKKKTIKGWLKKKLNKKGKASKSTAVKAFDRQQSTVSEVDSSVGTPVAGASPSEGLRDFEALQAHREAKAARIACLEAALQAKEQEIDEGAEARHDELIEEGAYEVAGAVAEGPDPSMVEEIKMEFMSCVEELWGVMAANGMDAALPLNFTRLPKALLVTLKELIDRALMTCQRAFRLGGPDVEQLRDASMERATRQETLMHPHEDWIVMVRQLNLSAGQRAALIAAHEHMVAEYDRIFTKRQDLNQAIRNGIRPDSPQQNLEAYFKEVLDELEENLREEQRAVCEEHLVTWKQVLNPVQGAWVIIRSFPEHCDSMALWSAVTDVFG